MSIRTTIRSVWLVVLLAAVVAHREHLAIVVPLALVAAVAFLAWTRVTRRVPRPVAAAASLAVVGVAAGVLSIWSSVAIGFIAAAGVAAGSSFAARQALAVVLPGPVTLAVASAAAGWSNGLVAGGAAAAFGGLVGGIGRRQAQDKLEQETRIGLARELHDVLAHTLGAVAIQLEAADAVNDAGDREQLREILRRSRSLVAGGLEETAEAVRALRDEPVPIVDRIASLVDGSSATLRVDGTPRVLPPRAGLALYRAAQEAITNARKHAPEERAELSLAFRDRETVLTVTNATTTLRTDAPGAGVGLQGMRERLELAGGHLRTEASGEMFTLEAAVPA